MNNDRVYFYLVLAILLLLFASGVLAFVFFYSLPKREQTTGVTPKTPPAAVKVVPEPPQPPPVEPPPPPPPEAQAYAPIVQWFSSGQRLEVSDGSPFDEHLGALRTVTGLEECARTHLQPGTAGELAGVMELVLDGLHQCSMLAKEDADHSVGYRDMIGAMFRQMEGIE